MCASFFILVLSSEEGTWCRNVRRALFNLLSFSSWLILKHWIFDPLIDFKLTGFFLSCFLKYLGTNNSKALYILEKPGPRLGLLFLVLLFVFYHGFFEKQKNNKKNIYFEKVYLFAQVFDLQWFWWTP